MPPYTTALASFSGAFGGGKDLLIKSKSTLFEEGTTAEKNSRRIIGPIYLAVIAYAISLFIVSQITGNSSGLLIKGLGYDSLLFFVVFLYAGWAEFSLYQMIGGIPTAKVAGAAEGLNEIQCRFRTESGKPLLSKVTGSNCIAYDISIWALEHQGKTTVNVLRGSYSAGDAAILYDETGFLIIDPYNTDFKDVKGNYWQIVDKKGNIVSEFSKDGQAIIQAFGEGFGIDDLRKMGYDISKSGKNTIFESGQMSLSESYIPTDNDLFAMGRIIDSAKQFESKVVKNLVVDPQTKLLALTAASRKSIISEDRSLSLLSFGLALILLLAGLYVVVVNPNIGTFSATPTGSYPTTIPAAYFTTTINYQNYSSTTIPQGPYPTAICAQGYKLAANLSTTCGQFDIELKGVNVNRYGQNATFTITAGRYSINATVNESSSYGWSVNGYQLDIAVDGLCGTSSTTNCSPVQWAEITTTLINLTSLNPSTTIPQPYPSGPNNCSSAITTFGIWNKWPYPSPQASYVQISSSGPSSISYIECLGMPYQDIPYGVSRLYKANSTRTKLSFDWQAESGTAISQVTNAYLRVYDPATNITMIGIPLVQGATINTYMKNYTAVFNTTVGEQIAVVFYSINSWAQDWSQQATFSNVTISPK
ncbi:MAG: hypothetical protein KGH78_02090 [Candidatus Micrarchaeota archaeon]|nr:hypothetical protein [Candidatus Micrarchaeota archaeon]